MEQEVFRGIWPVLAIPFLENGEIDEQSLRREIDFEIDQGVDGVVIFGLAGEQYKLSDTERLRTMEITVSQAEGQVPVIAGTEHTGSEVAAERSHQAQELGVSGVMVYPPTFVTPDTAGVVDYYHLISDRLEIPMMIQDAQTWTRVPLPIDLLSFLHREIPAVQYVKVETVPTGPKISKLLEETGEELAVFGGYGGLHYLEEMERGVVGTLIPPAISDRFVRIHKAFHQGEHEFARELHHELLPFLLFEMASLDTLIQIQKLAFRKAGIFREATMRRPHTLMDKHQQDSLEAWLRRLDLAVLNHHIPDEGEP